MKENTAQQTAAITAAATASLVTIVQTEASIATVLASKPLEMA